LVSLRIAVWVLLTVGFASQTTVTYLLFPVLLLSLLLFLFAFSLPENSPSRHFYAWFFLLSIAGYLSGGLLEGYCARGNSTTADQLVAGIEAFREQRSRYPEKLDELVPEFMDAIPKAKLGFQTTRFFYSNRCDAFTLGYSSPVMMARTYDSQKKKWRLRD
jgi:hypothetical protein